MPYVPAAPWPPCGPWLPCEPWLPCPPCGPRGPCGPAGNDGFPFGGGKVGPACTELIVTNPAMVAEASTESVRFSLLSGFILNSCADSGQSLKIVGLSAGTVHVNTSVSLPPPGIPAMVKKQRSAPVAGRASCRALRPLSALGSLRPLISLASLGSLWSDRAYRTDGEHRITSRRILRWRGLHGVKGQDNRNGDDRRG
jgi:hypothetical protein